MSEEARRIRVHLLVRGRVQGVGFRYATVREARRLRLRGWVRNTAEGGVEIVAEGSPEVVGELVTWCRIGPPAACVTDVLRTELEPGQPLPDFRVQ